MSDSVPFSRFETAYSADAPQPPWDISGPQKAFVDVADQIQGLLLDSGCGTGENALYFASRGCTVTGIDLAQAAIRRAKVKSEERGIAATFLVKDGLTLSDWNEASAHASAHAAFDNIIDSGVFHVFSDEDAKQYVAGLAHVLKPGGRLFLICFSDAEPGTHGPRRIPKQILYDRFRDGWKVESVTATRFNVRPEYGDTYSSDGGPKAWFAIVKRVGG